MPIYERNSPPRNPAIAVGVPLVLLLIIGGLLAWHYWPAMFGGEVNVEPRAVTPRGDLGEDEKATIKIFEQTAPSVVHITTLAVRNDPYSRFQSDRPVKAGIGSGFVWDKQGHIVTNFHVIANASGAEVNISDRSGRLTTRATLVGVRPEKDLAVIKVSVAAERLQPILVGSSSDLKVGQKAFAIGNPFGLDQSLTTGVISALNREIQGNEDTIIKGVIQTDAAINPGNSGGPLLDSYGRLIGVNTAIYSPSGASAGIGFAIPVDDVNDVVTEIINKVTGKSTGPQLGVHLAADQLARRIGVNGVVVAEVLAGSPAHKVGLKPLAFNEATNHYDLGDVIVNIDGQAIRAVEDLRTTLRKRKVGDSITITVIRDGAEKKLQVTLEAVR